MMQLMVFLYTHLLVIMQLLVCSTLILFITAMYLCLFFSYVNILSVLITVVLFFPNNLTSEIFQNVSNIDMLVNDSKLDAKVFLPACRWR